MTTFLYILIDQINFINGKYRFSIKYSKLNHQYMFNHFTVMVNWIEINYDIRFLNINIFKLKKYY